MPQVRLPARPWVAAPCLVCSKRGVTQDPPTFIHEWCQGVIRPCDICETAPSMPYPLCTWCQGRGLVEKEICRICPPGPCIKCCMTIFLERVRGERQA